MQRHTRKGSLIQDTNPENTVCLVIIKTWWENPEFRLMLLLHIRPVWRRLQCRCCLHLLKHATSWHDAWGYTAQLPQAALGSNVCIAGTRSCIKRHQPEDSQLYKPGLFLFCPPLVMALQACHCAPLVFSTLFMCVSPVARQAELSLVNKQALDKADFSVFYLDFGCWPDTNQDKYATPH